jgi:hypothetical protein
VHATTLRKTRETNPVRHLDPTNCSHIPKANGIMHMSNTNIKITRERKPKNCNPERSKAKCSEYAKTRSEGQISTKTPGINLHRKPNNSEPERSVME